MRRAFLEGLLGPAFLAVALHADPGRAEPACEVRSVRRIGDGVQARWSQARQRIVFSRKVKGVLEIHSRTIDGRDTQCLTCGARIPGTARRAHKGQAAWHPNGLTIAFLATNDHGSFRSFTDFPGVGSNVDVYLMTADGKRYWQVTNYPAEWGALFPAFSADGRRLFWTEEYACSRPACPAPRKGRGPSPCCAFGIDVRHRAAGEELGLWRIMTVNLDFKSGEPAWDEPAATEVNHEGKRMLEGAGFTPDGDGFIFESVDIGRSNTHALCADVYTSDLSGRHVSFRRLTDTPMRHEENAAYSPNGKKIAYTSGPAIGLTYKTDLYLMNADGGGEARLTHFIDPGRPCSGSETACYDGRVHIVGDPSWIRDGAGLLFWSWDGRGKKADDSRYAENFCDGRNFRVGVKKAIYQFLHWPDFVGGIYLLEFAGSCGGT